MAKASRAVKAGVVAPTAWLKDTGMNLRLTLPSTTVRQKMSASSEIFQNWRRDLTACSGTMREAATAYDMQEQASMWHSVRNTGHLQGGEGGGGGAWCG